MLIKKIILFFPCLMLIGLLAHAQSKKGSVIHLFDAKHASLWRAYNGTTLPPQWAFKDGVLVCEGKTADKSDRSGDIVFGGSAFANFELTVEWKIKKGSNSGIFYHVVEGKQYHAPYETAPEYQVIDQLGFPEKLEMWQSIAADYGMYSPDYQGALREVGTWNETKIVFTEKKVEYWLNGKKTLAFVPWSKDWQERKSKGKWKDYPDYGKAKTGLIGLQNHGDPVEYRNLKIKTL